MALCLPIELQGRRRSVVCARLLLAGGIPGSNVLQSLVSGTLVLGEHALQRQYRWWGSNEMTGQLRVNSHWRTRASWMGAAAGRQSAAGCWGSAAAGPSIHCVTLPVVGHSAASSVAWQPLRCEQHAAPHLCQIGRVHVILGVALLHVVHVHLHSMETQGSGDRVCRVAYIAQGELPETTPFGSAA